MGATQSRTDWTIIGVPTSAGAHHAGQDRAPAALRAHGLAGRLRGSGGSTGSGRPAPTFGTPVICRAPSFRWITSIRAPGT